MDSRAVIAVGHILCLKTESSWCAKKTVSVFQFKLPKGKGEEQQVPQVFQMLSSVKSSHPGEKSLCDPARKLASDS